MKITGADQNIINKAKVEKDRRNRESSAENRSKNSPETDKVLISNTAKDIGKIREEAINSPDVRTDRVTEIKEKIEKGKYFINSEDIARKMLMDIMVL